MHKNNEHAPSDFSEVFENWLNTNKSIKQEQRRLLYQLCCTSVFLQSIRYFIANYANSTFTLINEEVKYNLNNESFISWYLDLDEQIRRRVLKNLQESIENNPRLKQYKNFLINIEKVYSYISFFYRLNIYPHPNLDYFELAKRGLEFQALLSELNDTSINDFLDHKKKRKSVSIKKLPISRWRRYKKNWNAIETQARTESDVSLLAGDGGDNQFTYRKRSFWQTVTRYVKANKNKLILATLGGLVLGATSIFLWPLYVPTALIGVFVAGTSVVTGLLSGLVTGLVHYRNSSKARQHANMPVKVMVTILREEPENDDEVKEGEGETITTSSNVAQKMEQQIIKNNLVSLMSLIISDPTMVYTLPTMTIADLIEKLKKALNGGSLILIPLAIKFFSDDFTKIIDLTRIEKVCRDGRFAPVVFEIKKYLNLSVLNNLFYSIKFNALMQMYRFQEIKLDNVKATLDKDYQQQLTDITPEKAASHYFLLLERKNKDAKQFKNLFVHLTSQDNIVKTEIERIRNALIYFIEKMTQQRIHFMLTEEELLEEFFKNLTNLNAAAFERFYLELLLNAEPTYNLNFLINLIRQSARSNRIKEKLTEQFDQNCLNKKQPLLNAISLFLKYCGEPQNDKKDPNVVKNTLANFYRQVSQLSLSNIVNILSELRFCRFIQLDLEGLKGLIRNFFDHNANDKLNLFDQELRRLQNKEYIAANVMPIVTVLKTFVTTANPELNFEQTSDQEIITLFYKSLNESSSEVIATLYQQVLLPIHDEHVHKAIENLCLSYFQILRPFELEDIQTAISQAHSHVVDMTCSS